MNKEIIKEKQNLVFLICVSAFIGIKDNNRKIWRKGVGEFDDFATYSVPDFNGVLADYFKLMLKSRGNEYSIFNELSCHFNVTVLNTENIQKIRKGDYSENKLIIEFAKLISEGGQNKIPIEMKNLYGSFLKMPITLSAKLDGIDLEPFKEPENSGLWNKTKGFFFGAAKNIPPCVYINFAFEDFLAAVSSEEEYQLDNAVLCRALNSYAQSDPKGSKQSVGEEESKIVNCFAKQPKVVRNSVISIYLSKGTSGGHGAKNTFNSVLKRMFKLGYQISYSRNNVNEEFKRIINTFATAVGSRK
jgi:hypothetical protein